MLLLVIAWRAGARQACAQRNSLCSDSGNHGGVGQSQYLPGGLDVGASPRLATQHRVRLPRPRPVPAGLATIAKPAALVVAAAGVALAGMAVALSVPIPVGSQPVGLVKQIAANPTFNRVLNNYNISGLVLWFARPDVSKSLCRWGLMVVRIGMALLTLTNTLSMQRGKTGWDATVTRLNPNVALLADEDALVPLLQSRGWQVIDERLTTCC